MPRVKKSVVPQEISTATIPLSASNTSLNTIASIATTNTNTSVTETPATAENVSGSEPNLAQQYQRKTDKQHILDNPDTYIGSVETVDADMWVYNEESNKIMLKTIEYVPGLYKLFDEGIVNCRDHVIRMIQSSAENKKCVTYIDVTVAEDGLITMENDGNGIDVAKHPEYDIWIPELVFGHLRTSTNYNKDEKRIVGGKNGFGFKLVLIWSTYGKIETVDHVRGLKYVQEFENHLDVIHPPTITKVKTTKPYTRVSFRPDYARLGVSGGLTPDMISLFKKRVYDIGAVTDHSNKKIKVTYNENVIPVKNFQQYIDIYLGQKSEMARVYEEANERWEYAVSLSPTHEFTQISFVNGIATFKGGKHVDYIIGQITRRLVEYIEKKKKVKVNPNNIKEQLVLFLRCDIENPAFDSQTKDFMNTPSSKFGSSCTVSDTFIEKIAKMGVMEVACSLTEAKDNRMAKKTDGTKTKNIRGIANFIDANYGGTEKSRECTLILCEGLSALSGIVSGLSKDDRNTIGIYPLKGKLLNVRGEQIKKISENKEITDIKKILGLETGRVYTSIEDVYANLRYGKIMLMTDQDMDGSHIKGLCINLFHTEWASLVKIPGFISFMNTPILRARKGSETVHFYNEGEYSLWKNTLGEKGIDGWTIKYFKGLGTSTSVEFKEYFANKKIVDFTYQNTSTDNAIDKIFNKKRTDDRKEWLEKYDKTAFLDTSRPAVQYEEFIDNELIHFSTYDCARSIPNMVDGLKISLRKILFCAFKKRLYSEIKVGPFSGYVSDHSRYHHGEASLNGAIINMAQNFVGSNNINLLEPIGQFGTRLQGGDDSASERYIFTQLTPLTRYLFPEADDHILQYMDDDGTRVEPEYYVPVIPLVLLNGISGIGTGFSCSIPAYNPATVIEYLKIKLEGGVDAESRLAAMEFMPYYEGFTGTIHKMKENKYLVRGKYVKLAEDKIRIVELPVGTWTMPYITFLEELMDGTTDKNGKKITPSIKDFTSICTESIVDITVQFPKGKLAELEELGETTDGGFGEICVNGVEKLLKLTTTISSTNMHMFDHERKLRKYNTVQDIIEDFYTIRLSTYRKRKEYLLENMDCLLVKLSNRAKYIIETLEDIVDLRKKTSAQVNALLEGRGYAKIEGDYKYLVKMPMDSVTDENVKTILKEKEDTEKELEILKNTSEEQIWRKELDVLEKEYQKYRRNREGNVSTSSSGENDGGAKKTVKRIVKRPVVKK
jgi:DNA topoisomerase-2